MPWALIGLFVRSEEVANELVFFLHGIQLLFDLSQLFLSQAFSFGLDFFFNLFLDNSLGYGLFLSLFNNFFGFGGLREFSRSSQGRLSVKLGNGSRNEKRTNLNK